jgi:cysteinyl-tRNA synthetase
MLSAHYRSPLNFSDDLMEAAKAGYERIVTCVSNLNFMLEKERPVDMTAQEQELLKQAQDMRGRFESVMDDDFNTADAISVIFDMVRFANSNTDENSAKAFLEALRSEIIELAGVCGLIVERREELQDAEI